MVPTLLLVLLALAVAYAVTRTLAFIRRLDADLDTPLPLAFEDPNSIKPVSVGAPPPKTPPTLRRCDARASVASNTRHHLMPFPPPPRASPQNDPKQIPCPSILDGPASVSLSVVIPAYNEEARLPATLDEVLAYLQRRQQRLVGASASSSGGGPFTWEVLVVDDGSRDATARVALEYARRHPGLITPAAACCVRVLRLPRNRGKGMAVREGALASRGALVLFADADGATRFSDVELLERALDESCASSFGGKAGSAAGAVRRAMAAAAAGGAAAAAKAAAAAATAAATAGGTTLPADPRGPVGMALGSRAHLQAAAVAQRTPLRNALMHGFHLAVRLAAGEGVVAPIATGAASGGSGGSKGIRDTQCGFKLATRRAAASLFANQRLQRWCFDVELALLAARLGVPLREVGVCWTEMPGSKIRPTSVLHMAWELCVLRLAYGVLPALGMGGGWAVRGEADERGGGLSAGGGRAAAVLAAIGAGGGKEE
jgi:dolichyl-phosphate beta-glucosyltransferase